MRGELRTDLTARERDVLRELHTGAADKEIGARLGIATGSVKVFNQRIFRKLGVANRVEAALIAERRNLLEAEKPMPPDPPVIRVPVPQGRATNDKITLEQYSQRLYFAYESARAVDPKTAWRKMAETALDFAADVIVTPHP